MDFVTNRVTPGGLEKVYLAFLAHKIGLLLIFSMPVEYFFGLKTYIFEWASYSLLLRLYIRFLAPTGTALTIAVTWLRMRRASSTSLLQSDTTKLRFLAFSGFQ